MVRSAWTSVLELLAPAPQLVVLPPAAQVGRLRLRPISTLVGILKTAPNLYRRIYDIGNLQNFALKYTNKFGLFGAALMYSGVLGVFMVFTVRDLQQ